MSERKYFVWNEVTEGISLAGTSKLEEDQKKNRGKLKLSQKEIDIFCPHSYLVFNFQEALSTNQEIKFRKHFMRKSKSKENDIIYLQDVKNLVLYLTTNRISVQFINFFHLPIADCFLRALIIYFQYYLETWEEMMTTRNAIEKKIENPLAHGEQLKRANDLNCLRLILASEYSNLLIGSNYGEYYHHMMIDKKSFIQSQHEKDLRIFETLLAISHQVIWIALQRKFYNLIEIELHRLFRNDSYNIAERKNPELMKNIKDNERVELHGPKMRKRRKLLRNSSLPYQLLNSECDFRLLALDSLTSKDPRVIFFQNALHLEEDKLGELGIKVGILGMPRSNFDHLLLPISEPIKNEDEDLSQDQFFPWKINLEKSFEEIPNARPDFELNLKLEKKSKFYTSKKYNKSRKEERKKWIDRAIILATRKQKDIISTTTTTWEHN
ncbi:uncharacterized protein LOC127280515 isoform X2 [Leptopilina boulardi]|uniref:uncharacterized protein LOC127280515 isoform X2 n=1 Tax=Leptopilina boulardi TaxID=63433 RepID=UPI0021F5164B|nr:uncharacterized protein LOC127280515 isoform X2 [Leptopilina boulardi]